MYFSFIVIFVYSNMSNAVTVLLPFHFRFLSFLSLVWLLWLRLSVLCWVKFASVSILILFLILEEMLLAFHLLDMMLSGHVEIHSLFAHFLESFYHKWVSNFVKSFSCIYWDDHMVFIFQFVNMVYHLDWFVCTESLHLWYKTHLIMVYEYF